MLTKKTSCVAGLAIIVFLCAGVVVLGQPTPHDKDSRISIHGSTYTVVDRFEYTAYSAGFQTPVGVYREPEVDEACANSNEPPPEPPLEWLLRIPSAKSTGFAISTLKMRVFRHSNIGPPLERGTIEFAVYNPCRDPIAVPVAWNGDVNQVTLADNASPVINMMDFLFLISDGAGQTVLNGTLIVTASAGKPESYRVLQPNEAVIYGVTFEILPSTMSRDSFLRIARNMRSTASYCSLSISEDGSHTPMFSIGANGTRSVLNFNVPYDPPPVPVEVDN